LAQLLSSVEAAAIRGRRDAGNLAEGARERACRGEAKLDRDLGTRHRAAIGLTEENDAIAVVVSEETGTISVVVDGEIERGFDVNTLRARLRSLILHRRSRVAANPTRAELT